MKTRYKIILLFFTVGALYFIFKYPVFKREVGVGIVICKSDSVDSIYAITDSIVKPVLYQKVPNLKDIHYKDRVVKFIDMMLPSVLLAREKMILKREGIIQIVARIKEGKGDVEDSVYVENIQKTYKSESIEEVIKRLHPHPVSIILAQAAIESGWSTSRFCQEGNNVFGIWSYNSSEKRIKAGESRRGTDIYLRKYESVFESVYDYLETIAKVSSYKEFREMRQVSDNPYRLIWYLSNYSEKRYEYVRNLRNVMEFSNLIKYDSYKLQEIKAHDHVWMALLE